jgi:hypothetical protein
MATVIITSINVNPRTRADPFRGPDKLARIDAVFDFLEN